FNTSSLVAEGVRETSTTSAREIKGLPVAYVCRTALGLPPPSPMDDHRVSVRGERMVHREEGRRTCGGANGQPQRGLSPEPLPEPLSVGRSLRHARRQHACAPTALRFLATGDPARAPSAWMRHGYQGLNHGALRHTAHPAAIALQECDELALGLRIPLDI